MLASAPYAALSRADALAWYQNVFRPQADVAPGWTGNVANGNAGTLDQAYQQATLARINAYRYMAGINDNVVVDAAKSRLAQAAALMMSANGTLSHDPPSTWQFYTSDGHEGAGKSNLALGAAGSDAIDLYMNEGAPAGHRRWLLYPPETSVGIGDIPTTDRKYRPTNATYVLTNDGPRGAVSQVAWPGPGFFPADMLPDAFSFAVNASADFSTANVVVSRGGGNVPVNVVSKGGPRYGDPAIEWTIDDPSVDYAAADQTYDVRVTHVQVDGKFRDYAYSFTVYDTRTAPPSPPTVAGTAFSLANTSITVPEGAGYVDVVVKRSGDVSGAASIGYATLAGTATDADFTSTSGRLTFAAGQTSGTVRVPIRDDTDREAEESFTVFLFSPIGAGTAGGTTATVTLTDNDRLPTRVSQVTARRVKAGLSELIVTFDDSLNSATATSLDAFSLRRAGRDRKLGTRDDVVIRFSGVTYDAGLNQVRLKLAKAYRPRENLRLVIKGASVTDSTGQNLDGDGDGKPGGDGFRNFRS